MIDNIISEFVIWWCKRKLKQLRNLPIDGYEDITIFYIKGTGKDYPDYLMFTDVERVRNEMMKI